MPWSGDRYYVVACLCVSEHSAFKNLNSAAFNEEVAVTQRRQIEVCRSGVSSRVDSTQKDRATASLP